MLLNVRANRFTVYVMPLVFILFNALINEAAAGLSPLAGRRLAAAAAVLGLVSADGLWLAADAAANRRDLAVSRRPWTTAGQAPVFRALAGLRDEIPPGAWWRPPAPASRPTSATFAWWTSSATATVTSRACRRPCRWGPTTISSSSRGT